MNPVILKNSLKPALISLYDKCQDGDEGMAKEEYADNLSEIIANKVIEHIQNFAMVTTTVTGTAAGAGGPYPVTGTGTGGIS